jgi:mycofactocin system glycosyltransferase
VGSLNRFTLDTSARRLASGAVLIGGSPLKLFRLTASGARVVDALEAGAPLPASHSALTDRLLDAGAIHPRFEEDEGYALDPADVTLVIPVHRADPARVAAIVTATGAGRNVVIDDASPWPFPGMTGVETVRLAQNVGPAGARNAGLDLVETPFVAFVDADVTVPRGWCAALGRHFADTDVALVAPRVRAATRPGVLARFEHLRSPLDLGPQPARIRAGSRVAYVPAAALLCRTEALRSLGGFDATMRVGEDVDLVWRLDEHGWRCRYEPVVEVRHDVRPGLRAWFTQRRVYGTSAAALAARHAGAVAPVQVSAWSAASWGLAAAGAPSAGITLAAASSAALVARLPEGSGRLEAAVRLAGLGHLHAGRLLASAMTRSYWPIALAAALVSRRARRALLVAALVPSLGDWWRVRREIDPASYVALRLLDDVAYGTGVWQGALTVRCADALRPDLSSWPRPQRYERARTPTARPSR